MTVQNNRWANANQSFMPVHTVTVTTTGQELPDDDTFTSGWDDNTAAVVRVNNTTDAAKFTWLVIKTSDSVDYVSLTPRS